MVTQKILGALLLAGGALLAAVDLSTPATAYQDVDHDTGSGGDTDVDDTARQKGPCVPLTYGTFPSFDCGADNCSGWFGSCEDGSWTLISYTPGHCAGQEGGCTTFPSVQAAYVRVDCKCQSDGTTCAFHAHVFTGTTVVTACAAVASDGTSAGN